MSTISVSFAFNELLKLKPGLINISSALKSHVIRYQSHSLFKAHKSNTQNKETAAVYCPTSLAILQSPDLPTADMICDDG